MVYNSIPSAAQVIAITDALSAVFDTDVTGLGLGLPGETGTSAVVAAALKLAVTGDGSSGNPGLGSVLAASLAPYCDSLLTQQRYDVQWSVVGRGFFMLLDSQVQNNLPAGWVFSSATSTHNFNNWMTRLNAAHVGVPTTPASAGTLTAVNSASGAIPNCASGNCPRVVHTLVGTNSWDESLPSAEATQVAISGPNDALSYQIGGTVPAGTTSVNVYRSLVAGATSVYFLASSYAVVAGAAYPAMVIASPDCALRQDILPPVWLSCLIKPQVAVSAALAYAILPSGGIQPGVPMSLIASHMVTETNVALNASNAFLGIGNQPSSATYGTRIVGTGYTAGAILAANSATNNLQGFAGSTKLQARVTGVLNAAGSLTATYTYYDAAHGWGAAQTATTGSASFGGTTVGSTAVLTIPAGRMIQTVTTDTPSGMASGTYILEGLSVR